MKWVLGLLSLIFLIIFHEFGHFLAAKLFGVKVESFSVGFGPVLLHKKIKDTDWRLSLLPLGGYCGMKGEKDFQQAVDEELDSIVAEPDSLYGIHPLKRAAIGFAGPFFNFIFCVLACTIINAVGYKYATYSNKINVVEPENDIVYPAYKAGLKSGDKILSINGKEVSDYSEIREQIVLHGDEILTLVIERDNEILTYEVNTMFDKEQGIGILGIMADPSVIIEKETPHYNFFQSIGHGFSDTFNYIGLTFKGISALFKGMKVTNAISGPVRATYMMGSAMEEGFKADLRTGLVSSLTLMGVISLSLFIMNLLPIPVLDGGLILIAVIEAIFRKKIKPKFQYYIQFIGLGFIAILFVVGLVGDITYFVNRSK